MTIDQETSHIIQNKYVHVRDMDKCTFKMSILDLGKILKKL